MVQMCKFIELLRCTWLSYLFDLGSTVFSHLHKRLCNPWCIPRVCNTTSTWFYLDLFGQVRKRFSKQIL